MGKITVTPCDIEGLYVIEPTVFKDGGKMGAYFRHGADLVVLDSVFDVRLPRGDAFAV